MTPTYPAPPINAEAAPFYAAAAEGRFLLPWCLHCSQPHWYPRARCPFCFGETEWRAASGRAEIYSFSSMPRANPPLTVAYVTLAEGPVMLTNLVDCDPEALAIGQPVTLRFCPTEGGPPIPCFTPLANGATP